MKRQREFEALLSTLSDAYAEIDDVYLGAVHEAEAHDKDWVKKREGLRKAVYDTINEIRDRGLREQSLSQIVDMRYRFEPKEPFIRMCYYIDRLNEIHPSKKIRRANPNYGKTVVENIARCASQILGYLVVADESRRADLRPAKEAAAGQIQEKWNEAFESSFKPLAHKEALDIIAEVEAEFGGYHG